MVSGPALAKINAVPRPYLAAGRLVIALDRDMRIDQGIYLPQPEAKHKMKPQAILLRDWLIDAFQE